MAKEAGRRPGRTKGRLPRAGGPAGAARAPRAKPPSGGRPRQRSAAVAKPPPNATLEALEALGLFASDVVEERPWGLWVDWYRTSEATLKCMVVHPGARMSLQRHRERAEVWRVISGRGEDQGSDPPMALTPGKTHVVGVGAVHRIANTGTVPLVIVELQMGHCDEHDIERLDDDYQR